jgi:hypothetical protein
MSTANETISFPFNKEQIEEFKKELKESGSFENLMLSKRALMKRKGKRLIRNYNNIEKYKTRFLKGVYEPLRPIYDTEVPYIFWNALHEIILKENVEII